MPTTTELRQKRASLIKQSRDLLERADAEKRPPTAEERQQFDRLHEEAGTLKAEAEKIEQEEALAKGDADRRRLLESTERELGNRLGRVTDPGQISVGATRSGTDGAVLIRLRGETLVFEPGTPGWMRNQPEPRRAFGRWLATGQPQAALQTDVSTAGGYLVVPEEFVAELIKDVDNICWIRQLARKFVTNAQTLGAPKRTNRMASFAWGQELTDAETIKDTALKFGKRSLSPHYMTGMILVSRDLLRVASTIIDPEGVIRYEISRDSNELEEKAFLAGSGAEQPLGVFTASADGIDTTRDFSTGNTTTTFTYDGILEAKYGLKAQYRNDPSIAWVFHRDAVKMLTKLKDGEGRYLWQASLQMGQPDRLASYPFYESEFAPNTFTTGQYVGILGCWRFYWIADGLELQLQQIVEKYANTNQVGFICRKKTDAMPQVAEAFSRVKLA